jgi:hypothetical protein
MRTSFFFFFFFFNWLYNPWWVLASLTAVLQASLSATFVLHPLIPIVARSTITLSIHLLLGCPLLLLLLGLLLSILSD